MTADSLQPNDSVLILDGPLRGGIGTVVSIEDGGRRIRAFVEKQNQLTPPVELRVDQIKKIHAGFWFTSWYDRVLMLAMAIAALWFKITLSTTALAILIGGVIVGIGRIFWLGYRSRLLKSCPNCGSRLDPETWSACGGCGWKRPMPTFVEQ